MVPPKKWRYFFLESNGTYWRDLWTFTEPMDSTPGDFTPAPHFWSEAKMQRSQFFAHRLELHLRWIFVVPAIEQWSRNAPNWAPINHYHSSRNQQNRTEVLSYYSMLKLHRFQFWCFFATQLRNMLVKNGYHFPRGKNTKCLKPPASLASLQNSLNIFFLMSTVKGRNTISAHQGCKPFCI